MEGEEVDFGDAEEMAKEPEAGGSSKGAVRDAAGRRMKGRGAAGSTQTMQDEGGDYDSIDSKGGSTKGPAKSIEGWIIFVTNLHEETTEDDLHDAFCDIGDIKNLHLNLDRRTGFVKGYALVEYEKQKDAQGAIDEMNGSTLMGSTISVDWAFSAGPSRAAR
ncbi:hypothetical protein EMIHUDRAFT_413893 [Emiliania huxleyi CCMP1516]|uniref:RNA-binding protein 8A n=3 Tax=Emiliania huxleyi TaxID=2903 RepID=A0A0D3HY79_EMIH1|nr:hypothetical protein EMIHUDRAFT_413981 [Emiliania huxleyi CCMP1516]XP_005768673.1 hypothetical protein EMIHUDRAFT_413893 [Emiliania huxleyi CCMP1516]EOD03964.1 hypothetical protein EMIHUDRAFT_413981 [Emiliania huxleyi CCMP1516]EOD16244.1 hypothetical protein EMIHUDRAFT_413893 [Emiliania huxleyi CCMP1516]|mmetsp:Transcript_479/g.1430  ORF Transcript_479/g.1430 Transcript_479/m.1430 type:complete len:162 (-) Transcript_479:219-704(-)|eukprot:XP_005756393.1 hypothetical protein EMIHUDRAFT_413981 [Emiliania huxleyi CCMP1516]